MFGLNPNLNSRFQLYPETRLWARIEPNPNTLSYSWKDTNEEDNEEEEEKPDDSGIISKRLARTPSSCVVLLT